MSYKHLWAQAVGRKSAAHSASYALACRPDFGTVLRKLDDQLSVTLPLGYG
jgi:hypothetical protein